MTRLAIVIVSYNAKADLDACLASLHARPPHATHRIVVVDNASTDGSLDLVRRRWPQVQTIASPENVGFARANNLGIRATESELVLLLNSDTLVPSVGAPSAGVPSARVPSEGSTAARPGHTATDATGTMPPPPRPRDGTAIGDESHPIDCLIAALDRDPQAAIAGPRLVDAEGRAELSFGRMMSPLNEARQKLLGALYTRRAPIAAAYVHRLLSRPGSPDWVSGACLLARRADAEAVGLLDERFFMYTEDVDFCAAIRARGPRILFVPEAEIVHLRGRSRQSALGATQAAYRRSQLAFYEKHHPRWAPWLRLYLRATARRTPGRASPDASP